MVLADIGSDSSWLPRTMIDHATPVGSRLRSRIDLTDLGRYWRWSQHEGTHSLRKLAGHTIAGALAEEGTGHAGSDRKRIRSRRPLRVATRGARRHGEETQMIGRFWDGSTGTPECEYA